MVVIQTGGALSLTPVSICYVSSIILKDDMSIDIAILTISLLFSSISSDLALSVTMTAISTILAIIMLPLNLAIYTPLIFKGEDDVKVTEMLDFGTLVTSICVVFGAIGAGIMASVKIDNHNFHIFANRVSCVICVRLLDAYS